MKQKVHLHVRSGFQRSIQAGNRFLLLFTMAMLTLHAQSAIVDGARQKPTYETPGFVTDTEVYLYNVGARQFFTEGNKWGTQASVGETGLLVKFTVSDGAYLLNDFSIVKDAWKITFFGSETSLFVDRNNQSNYFFDVEDNGSTFRLSTSSQNPTFGDYAGAGLYVGLKKTGGSTALSPFVDEDEAYVDWAIVTKENYEGLADAVAVYNKAQELKEWIDKIVAQNGDASSLSAVYLNEDATMAEIEAAIVTASPLYIQALINNAPDKENVDVTLALKNPDFEESGIYERNTAGWITEAVSGGNVRSGGTDENKCFEAWNNASFDIYQTLADMPVGVYEIEVQGFYRFDGGAAAYTAYASQSNEYVKPGGVPVYVYLNNNATPFANVFDEPVTNGTLYRSTVSDGNSPRVSTDGMFWYPNDMENSAIAFANGMYKKSAFGLIANTGDDFRIGVKGSSNQNNNSWVIWDNFKLRYRGFKADVVQPVLEETIADINANYIGLLMGKTEYAAFTTALNAAAVAIEDNDGEGMFSALNSLYDAKDPALTSKDIFLDRDVAADTLRLAEAIRSMDGQKLSMATLSNAEDLLKGIKENTIYENDDIDQLKADVDAMTGNLGYSVSVYIQFANAIDKLAAAIDEAPRFDFAQPIIDDAEELLGQVQLQYAEGSVTDAEVFSVIDSIENMIERFEDIYNYVDDADWNILKAAYPQMGAGTGWQRTWNFDTESQSVVCVPGVKTSNNRVVSIDLSNNNISGKFPFVLLTLPYLKSLVVANNQLSGNLGLEMYEYCQENPASTISITELNISGNQFTGNIGLFANCFPSLTSLDASGNCLEDVYPVIPSSVTTLDLSKQTIARVVPLHLANLSADYIATKMPSILLYDHANQAFTPNINLLCTTPDDTWGMTMAYQNGTLSIPYVSEQNTYYGVSGDTLNVAVLYNDGTREGSTFGIALSFDEGDGNFDGKVNILDLQTDILYIMENYLARPYNFTAANLWKDGQINVQDIICQVNLLMSNEADDDGQTATARRNAPAANAVTCEAEVYVQDHRLMLNSALPVAAFDIVVSGANSLTVARGLEQAGMTVSSRVQRDGLHIIGYALNGACIPSGVSTIGTLDAYSSVRSAMLSDGEANAVSVAIDGTTTGIRDIEDGELNIENCVYDLQGRKVNVQSRKGLYIQNGHKVVK